MLKKKRTLYLRGLNHGSSICYLFLVMHYSLHTAQPYNYANIYLIQVLSWPTNCYQPVAVHKGTDTYHVPLFTADPSALLPPPARFCHLALRCQGLLLLVNVLD